MSAPHDFFAAPELARPQVTVEQARAVVLQEYGLAADVLELGSQQERTFDIRADSGRYVLKVAHPAFSDDEVAAQDAAIAHVAERASDVDVPRTVPRLTAA